MSRSRRFSTAAFAGSDPGASPVLALLALGVRLSSRGPILFVQRRYGFNNEEFGVYNSARCLPTSAIMPPETGDPGRSARHPVRGLHPRYAQADLYHFSQLLHVVPARRPAFEHECGDRCIGLGAGERIHFQIGPEPVEGQRCIRLRCERVVVPEQGKAPHGLLIKSAGLFFHQTPDH